MADSDGDPLRCRWGRKENQECGSICSPKGLLTPDPCELTYNATRLGYAAVALVIEDFDSNNKVLSSIPLQFLIRIVNQTVSQNNSTSCSRLPVYVGNRPQGACIGVKSNSSVTEQVQFRIPCPNTSTTLANILTVSPPGMIRGPIIRDSSDLNLYSMEIRWTPESDQYGVHQLCLTPVDSQQQAGSQVCLVFQVDTDPPRFVRMHPTGIVPDNQSTWIIEVDRDIAPPRRSIGVNIRFFKRSNNQEVYRVDVTSPSVVCYAPRRIAFYTFGYIWSKGEEYYILLDSGVATINESCGIESAPVTDKNVWTFQIPTQTTILPSTTTSNSYLITTEKGTTIIAEKTVQSTMIATPKTVQSTVTTTQITSKSPTATMQTITSSASPIAACHQWFPFNTILNLSTNVEHPTFTFCFSVNTIFADVTIAANTWVPCSSWKNSGASDPLIELHSENVKQLLAKNDDGNSIPSINCYASVLSYRLPRGDYRVVIRNPKCAYGYCELRFLAEVPFARIDNST
ncbi:unnamed protein product [Rotaria sp. Silwood1]|nr:unnamed protein product [Rotaria sp. Silwood1]CAF4505442.1 unnamed protein product [Rotaria sp. Silwood1]